MRTAKPHPHPTPPQVRPLLLHAHTYYIISLSKNITTPHPLYFLFCYPLAGCRCIFFLFIHLFHIYLFSFLLIYLFIFYFNFFFLVFWVFFYNFCALRSCRSYLFIYELVATSNHLNPTLALNVYTALYYLIYQ